MYKKHLRYFSFYIFLALSSNLYAQVPSKYKDHLTSYYTTVLNVDDLKEQLVNAPMKGTVAQNKLSSVIIELPMPEGHLERFKVVKAPILSSELSATRPNIKSYVAKGVDDLTAIARFNISFNNFYGLVKSAKGIAVIEKIDRLDADNDYISYYDHDIITEPNQFRCDTEDTVGSTNPQMPSANRIDSCFQFGDNLRNYDLVLTCSGEFYNLNGGTDPLVETALLNRVLQINTVYETEMATTFTVVEFLLNSNPATDPFTDPTNTFNSVTESENYINANVSVPSWDIGHGFHEITCGGGCGWAGIAGLAVVCTSAKARGYTYLPNDIPTAITVLVHEFGHQFSNRHTNYGCNSNNACSRYEPGQGSTIMSTGAGCDAGDFYANRTNYFGITSLQNMVDYQSSGLFVTGTTCNTVTIGGWSDCADLTPTGNNMPSSNANANNIDGLVIPHSTPFVLNGSGTDADGTGSLTYNWEQYDTDYGGSDAPDDTGASTTAPLFRSFPPSTSSERTVPQLSSVLAGNVTTGTGEVLPTVARNLTWRLTVRDNEIGGGGVACDQIALSVGNDGPFRISSQNTTSAWVFGASETITWDVANTDNPIYTCANIDVLLSTDGGLTFPTTLASGVPNNGTTNITVPNVSTNAARVKLVCSGGTNIFFDINDEDILITSSCNAVVATIANSTPVSAVEGDAVLNLGLFSGLPVNSVSGVLDASDFNTNLTAEDNGSGNCIFFNNSPYAETRELVAASNSNVTFTITDQQPTYFNMVSLYQTSYSSSNVCQNWLNSNGDFDGMFINISLSFTETLTSGEKYVLLSSGFNNNEPNPGNYEITFSETLYDTAAINIAGYLYTYVVVNDATGTIVAFSDDSDLTDHVTFPAANYTVHGLSYLAGSLLSNYVGGAFTTLQTDIGNASFCGALSSNTVSVTITPFASTLYTYNSGAWAPTNPIGVIDLRDDIHIQSGDYTMTNNIECTTFTVDPGTSLTINSGINLNVANALNLESTSTSFSSLIVNGSVNGTINYSRFTAQVGPVGTNDLIAAPLMGQSFGNFDAANTNLAASGSTRAFAPYNTNAGAYQNYDAGTNMGTIIPSGVGYRAATTDGSNLIFTGTASSTNILDVPISDAIAGFAWNLIGNPFPSYLDFDAFFQQNRTEFESGTAFQAIYGYNGGASNKWTVWNQATIDEGSITERITPGQGFFVKSKSGGGLVDFTTAMRTTGNSDDFISGRPSPTNVALCKLNVNSNSHDAYTQIYFIEGTTRGLDAGYDAGSYRGDAGNFSIFSNLVEDNTGLDMAIQTLPYSDLTDVIIPLGINAAATHQLTVSLDATSTIPDDINVYLEDTQTNIYTLLNTNNYVFTPNEDLNGTGRFYIKFSSQVLSVDETNIDRLLIYTNQDTKELVIKGQLNAATSAKLYDVRGRLIFNKLLDTNSAINILDVTNLGTGVYVISLEINGLLKNQKIVIR